MMPPWSIQYRRNPIGGRLRIMRNDVEVAHLYVSMYGDDTIELTRGYTEPEYRRRSIGTWIRAIAVWTAKRAGFKKATQSSSYFNNTPRTPRPTSAYIMNKLGFTGKNENRQLNLNRNIKNVNEIIRQVKL